MTSSNKNFNQLQNQKNKSLSDRVKEDSDRDPLDALVEAKELHSLLLAINQRLNDPAMTHILSYRLRQDIGNKELIVAINEAKELVIYNERRFEQTLMAAKEARCVS